MGRDLVDHALLTAMAEALGGQTLAELLAHARADLPALVGDILDSWARSDENGFQDAAHRLKGAAASVGCIVLAEIALDILSNRRLTMDVSGAEMRALEEMARQTLEALAQTLG